MSTAIDIFAEPLAWLFWPATRPRTDSAWLGHVPFAHWIVGAARPKVIVELGTHSGASYAAFCESVARHGLETRCFAIDTWVGDKHAGGYGEDIYAGLETFNRERHAAFSILLRKTFDEALGDFAEGSIDLLHIDGLHTYEAVKHDFDSWQRKLSHRAIVLFHDTAEARQDFGVRQFWSEVSSRYPSFAFTHFHGLGVLQTGSLADGPVTALFALDNEVERQIVRDRFEALGNNVRNIAYAARMHAEAHRLEAAVKQLTRRGAGG